jgi:hypothetical protein
MQNQRQSAPYRAVHRIWQWPRDVVVALVLTFAALALLGVTLLSDDQRGRSTVATSADVGSR